MGVTGAPLDMTSRTWNEGSLSYIPKDGIYFIEFVDKEAKMIVLVVNFIIICGLIAYFGIIGNVVNLYIFTKQNVDNATNISLSGIAISDTCALLAVIWLGVCVNPLLQNGEVMFEELEYLTAGWPHCLFARITCIITVFITMERCLCVVIPLKVKNVFTRTRTIVIVLIIFVSQMLTAVPSYYSSYIGWKFITAKNKSVLGLCRIDNWEHVESVSFVLQAIMQAGSFVLLVLFTVILVYNIRKNTKWRIASTSTIQNNTISTRDSKLLRMIVLIAVILILCFTPGMICFVGMIFEPEYTMGGKYDNLFWVTWSVTFIFQTTNSSVNIFVYYIMSSNYRQTFDETFSICRNHSVSNKKGRST